MMRPILVIEDADEDFDVLSSSLRRADVPNEILRCATGREISTYMGTVTGQPASRCPAIILLDLNLPGADGRKVLRDLREHPLLRAVPVIILTTSAQPSDVEACYRLGASGYMVKPVDLHEFESMVRQMSDYWLCCVTLPKYPHVYTN
jgi:CheY-like chemotaxis protein